MSSQPRLNIRRCFYAPYLKSEYQKMSVCNIRLKYLFVKFQVFHLNRTENCSTRNSANVCLDKDVLKRSWRRLSSSPSEEVFKMSSRRLDQDLHICFVHTSSRILQNVFKTFSRCLKDVFQKRFQGIFKTSWRCFEDVLKIGSKRSQDVFKDVFKTS